MKKEEIKQLRKLSKIIFILGVVLLLTIYISEIIRYNHLSIEINIYEKLFASFMIYTSIAFHLLSKEKHPFKKSLQYIKSSSVYILTALFLMASSVAIGFVFAENFSFLNETLKEIISRTLYLNSYQLTAFILMNNAIAGFVSIVVGIILGIIPIISSIGNGVILGYVLQKVGISESWRLLPHGIFELPAIIISFGLGIKLGFSVFNKNKIKTFKERLRNALLAFTFIMIPLLVIAALIEGLLIALFP